MHLIAAFFAGAFLCNSIPHLAAGLQGLKLPTPFSKPRKTGFSSALVNFLWGSFNLLVATLLLTSYPVKVSLNDRFVVFAIGFLLLGAYVSRKFARMRH